MIYGIYGEGGTGKSALAVSLVIEHLSKFDLIITNIYGFGKDGSLEDIAKKLNTDIEIKIFKNTKEDFVQVLRDVEAMQKDKEEQDMKSILILYDECHKALRSFTKTNNDDVFISDFLSEHRHFHCDMYFMTQGYKKIGDIYKGDFTGWYRSVDFQFKTDSNSIEFVKLAKDNKTKIEYFKFKKDKHFEGLSGKKYKVFDCYTSGDDGKKRVKTGMTFLAKKKYMFIILFIIVFIVLIYAVFSVKSMFSDDSSPAPLKKESKKHYDDSNSSSNYDSANDDIFQELSDNLQNTDIVSKYIIINCLFDVDKKIYYFDKFSFNQINFDSFSKYFLIKIISTHKISDRFIKIQYLVDKNILFNFKSISGNSKNSSILK